MALPVNKSLSNSITARPGELRSISTFRGAGLSFQDAGSFVVYDIPFPRLLMLHRMQFYDFQSLTVSKEAVRKVFPSKSSETKALNRMSTAGDIWSQASLPQIYSSQGIVSVARPFDPQIKSSSCASSPQGPVLCFCIKIAVYLKMWMLASKCRESGPQQQFPLDKKILITKCVSTTV